MSKSTSATQPTYPDPTMVASQQTQLNAATGVENTLANNPTTSNPFATTGTYVTGYQYISDGNGGQIAVPLYQTNTSLNTTLQPLYNNAVSGLTNPSIGVTGTIANAGPIQTNIGNAGPIQSSIDPRLINQSLNSELARYMPAQQLRDQALNTQLINEGFSPDPQSGTNAYNEAQLLNSQSWNDAFNSFYNTAFSNALQGGEFANTAQQQNYSQLANNANFYNQAQNQQYAQNANNAAFQNSAAAQNYNQNSQSLAQLQSLGSGVPYTPNTVTPADIGSYYMTDAALQEAAYQAQLQAQATQNAGLYGGIGSVLGAGLTAAVKYSDRRVKRDIKQIGEWLNGLPVYLFRYIWSPLWHVGFMAQDVEKIAPYAVTEISGIKAVRYDLAMAARNGL